MYLEQDGSIRGYPRTLPPGMGSIWDDIGKAFGPVVKAVKDVLPGAAKQAAQQVVGAAQRAGAQQIAASPEGQAELQRQAFASIQPYLLGAGALFLFLMLRPKR